MRRRRCATARCARHASAGLNQLRR
jgi:hypothetical protein